MRACVLYSVRKRAVRGEKQSFSSHSSFLISRPIRRDNVSYEAEPPGLWTFTPAQRRKHFSSLDWHIPLEEEEEEVQD